MCCKKISFSLFLMYIILVWLHSACSEAANDTNTSNVTSSSNNKTGPFCHPSNCNHEGECVLEKGTYNCTCFENSRYYTGKFCNIPVDTCAGASCSSGTCRPGIGQFICVGCNVGTSGQNCGEPSDKLFRSFMFLSNRYVFYGQKLSYIMAFKCIGTEPMHLDLTMNNIKFDTFYLNSPNSTKKTAFRYCRSLPYMAESSNIRNIKYLFKSGYYFSSCLLLYEVGVHPLTVSIVETASGRNLYNNTFNIYVLKNSSSPCIFKVNVPYGQDPNHPITVPVSHFTRIRPNIYYSCSGSSSFGYKLQVFERETKKLIGAPIYSDSNHKIFIRPYTMGMRCEENRVGHFVARLEIVENTGQRPYYKKLLSIFVDTIPMPVKARIAGGTVRTVGDDQMFFLDGRKSRNECCRERENQGLKYLWTCSSPNDPVNDFCNSLKSSAELLKMHSRDFRRNGFYTFELRVWSRINSNRSSVTTQTINIVRGKSLDVIVVPASKLLYRQFVPQKIMSLLAVCIMPSCYGYKETQEDKVLFKWSLINRKQYDFSATIEESSDNEPSANPPGGSSGTNPPSDSSSANPPSDSSSANPPSDSSGEESISSSGSALYPRFSRIGSSTDAPLISSERQRFIFTAPGVSNYTIELNVIHKIDNSTAQYFYDIDVIEPPTGGQCQFENPTGQEFVTQFILKCGGYSRTIYPLRYGVTLGKYMIGIYNEYNPEAQRMPIRLQVPEGNMGVVVHICNIYKSCTDVSVPVTVTKFEFDPDDLKTIMMENNHELNLEHGESSKVILLMSLISRTINGSKITETWNDLGCFSPGLVTEINLLAFALDFYMTTLPLKTHEDANLYNMVVQRIASCAYTLFQFVQGTSLFYISFQNFNELFYNLMGKMAKPTQLILPSLELKFDYIYRTSSVYEIYLPLPDLIPKMTDRPMYWAKLFQQIDKVLTLLQRFGSMQQLYSPGNPDIIIESNQNIYYQLISYEGLYEQTYSHFNIKVNISAYTTKLLQCKLKSNALFIQLIYFKEDPFWWIPKGRLIATNVLYMKIFGRNGNYLRTFQSSDRLSDPEIKVQLEIRNTNESIDQSLKDSETDDEIKEAFLPISDVDDTSATGELRADNERLTHLLTVKANQYIKITFPKATKNLRIKIQVNHNPSVYELLRSKTIVKQTNENTSSSDENVFTLPGSTSYFETINIYISIMAANSFEGIIEYAMGCNIVDCLSFEVEQDNPFWESTDCSAIDLNDSHVTCSCKYASYISGYIGVVPVDSITTKRDFFYEMPVNPTLVIYYIFTFLLLLSITIAIYVLRFDNEEIIIIDQGAPSYHEGFTFFITTGSLPNAGTTSNLILRFYTRVGMFKAKIYQNPRHFYFQTSTTTTVHISSRRVKAPLTLEVETDKTGRFPSWYCESIRVIDLHDTNVYRFNVFDWVNKVQYDIRPENLDSIEHSKIYFIWLNKLQHLVCNWFNMQPILGPRMYGHNSLHVVQRTCLFVSQISVLLTTLVLLLGPTNFEYQENITLVDLFYEPGVLFLKLFLAYLSSLSVTIFFYLFTTEH